MRGCAVTEAHSRGCCAVTRHPIPGSVTNGTCLRARCSTAYPKRGHPNGGAPSPPTWVCGEGPRNGRPGQVGPFVQVGARDGEPNQWAQGVLACVGVDDGGGCNARVIKPLARQRRIALRFKHRRWPEQCQAGRRPRDTKSAAYSTVLGARAPVAAACSACWIAGVGIAMRRLSRNCSAAASRTTSTTGS